MPSEIIVNKSEIPWYRRPLLFTLFYLLLQPVALIIMLTGANYYRTKGGYRKWGKGLKAVLFTMGLIGFLFGLALSIGDAAKETAASTPSGGLATDGDTPAIRAELITGQFGEFVQLVGDDSKPFTVQRVVINGRAGDPGCDSSKTNLGEPPLLPATLKRGDISLYSGLCGRRVLTADIFTDRGNVTFKFHEDGN
jgi:hypothetical protein